MSDDKIKAFVRFNGDGEIIETSHPETIVLKIGIGNYIINPNDEDIKQIKESNK